MKTSFADRKTLLISLAITLVSFPLWVGLVLLAWGLLWLLGVPTDPWAMLSALSAAVAAAIVLGAGYFAYRELGEVTSSRHMEVADRLFSELNSKQNIEARRWIIQNLPDDPEQGMQSLSAEGRGHIKQVLNSLDRVAFLTQPNWIPEEMIMPWMSIMVVKAWTRLEPYVEYERARRHEPDYYRYAQRAAERCIAWRKQAEPTAEITWVLDAL